MFIKKIRIILNNGKRYGIYVDIDESKSTINQLYEAYLVLCNNYELSSLDIKNIFIE